MPIIWLLLPILQENIQGGNRIQDFFECLKILSSPEDEKEHENNITRRFQLYELVFTKDSLGNTPFHYAINYWPDKEGKEIILKLLEIGGGCSEKDMESIPSHILEEFLTEHCITSKRDGDVNKINFHLWKF